MIVWTSLWHHVGFGFTHVPAQRTLTVANSTHVVFNLKQSPSITSKHWPSSYSYCNTVTHTGLSKYYWMWQKQTEGRGHHRQKVLFNVTWCNEIHLNVIMICKSRKEKDCILYTRHSPCRVTCFTSALYKGPVMCAILEEWGTLWIYLHNVNPPRET